MTIAVSGTQYVITIGAASLGDTDNRMLGEFSYVRDLVIGYVLTGIASFRNIAGAFMASTGSYSMKKNKQK